MEKDCHCLTWLPILCGKLLGLFHRNIPFPPDASPLQDDESPLLNESISTSSMIPEGSKSLEHGNVLLPDEVDDESPLENKSISTSSMIFEGSKSLGQGNVLLLPDEVDDESPLNNKSIATSSMIPEGSMSLGHGNVLLLPDEVDDESPLDNESIATSSMIPEGSSKSLGHGNVLLLPDDILMGILTRLTFECVVLCRRVCRPLRQLTSTPFYNSMLLCQTTPIIAIQCELLCCKTFDKENKLRAYHVILHFVNQDNYIVALNTTLNLNYMPQESLKPSLIGSYNGLLWFSHFREKGLIIFNPVTKEQVIVEAPSSYYQPCGLYFHISTGEYRVLYVRCGRYGFEEIPYRFYVLSLRSKLLREIGESVVAPCTCTSPTILNGALHWMASVYRYSWCQSCQDRGTPPCSQSILVFKTNEEVLITIPHPGGYCKTKERHLTMQLLEYNGKLCLLDTYPSTSELYLWVLGDYKEQVWVIERIINIESIISKYLFRDNSHGSLLLTALDFRNNELLLKGKSSDILYYNLKLGTFRKVERTGFERESLSSVVVHKNTFATLDCDSVISLDGS